MEPADIPEEYRDIADTLGLHAYLTLSLPCGGQTLYILKRAARNQKIRSRFIGDNYRRISTKYRPSKRQIRKIIHKRH